MTERRVADLDGWPGGVANLLVRVAAAPLVFGLMAGCAPYTMMDFHREVLDRQARGHFDCEHGELEVVDETPEGFQYGRDPQAARYLVRACEQEDSYVCYQMPEANVSSPTPECRRLGEEPSIIHLGPIPL